MDNCIFCKIAAKDIPAQTVYEDDEMLCFKDIRPAAPVHLLLIPKVHFDSLAHAAPEHQTLLGKMMLKVPQIAEAAGLTDGFKTLINTGKGGGCAFNLTWLIVGRLGCWGLVVGGIVRVAWVEVRTNVGV